VTRVSLPQIWWMCSSDESRHRPCHPKLVVATSGESIQPAACCHETPIFEPPYGGKEGTVTHLAGESGRVWVTLHQSEQPGLEHASP
jgi:hypothetical protein